ncbi:MAG: OmpA family protein [bacterium]|nr:OmpA family protein [bacterium]
MRHRFVALVGLVCVVALVLSTGCVSKGAFRKNLEGTESRIDSAEDAIESNQRKLKDLEDSTGARAQEVDKKLADTDRQASSALNTAQQATRTADQAAKGKLLWEAVLNDDRVKFGWNENALSDDAVSVLEDLVRKIKGYGKAVYVEIQGHTDSSGSNGYNQELGARRAMVVHRYLNEKGGIPLHAMNTISYGEADPIADNSSKGGRAQNRRVVVRVLE